MVDFDYAVGRISDKQQAQVAAAAALIKAIEAPRVESCIEAVMGRFKSTSPSALARYYEEVHQHLGPLARRLECELRGKQSEIDRLTASHAAQLAALEYAISMGALTYSRRTKGNAKHCDRCDEIHAAIKAAKELG